MKSVLQLFPRERHDWMNFHSGDVLCPDEQCYGILKWTGNDRRELMCNACQAIFVVKPKVKLELPG